MLTLLFFQPENESPLSFDGLPSEALTDALADLPGYEAGAPACTGYQPGRWRDADTGAECSVDLGEAPLEDDPIHPPRQYAGWRPVGLTVTIPGAGPHWRCVEALRVVEHVLARVPGLRVLDVEDVVENGESEPGPFPFDKPRLIANWERARAARQEHVAAIPHLGRAASVAMWRYRRQRRAGAAEHPGLIWPDALAMLDTDDGSARSAAFWHDPAQAFALPPVELLIVPRAHGGAGVLPADEMLTAAGGGRPLNTAAAIAIAPTPALAALYAGAHLLPAARFRALGMDDWSD